jgi:hypothetical protein
VDKEAVAEAYGGVSAGSQSSGDKAGRGTHLKAGVRPKKATKVRAETATVKPMMARTTAMVYYVGTSGCAGLAGHSDYKRGTVCCSG